MKPGWQSELRLVDRRPSGISMVETVVALVVMAVAALSISDSLMTSMMNATSAKEHAAAYKFAREKLEAYAARGAALKVPTLTPVLPNGVIQGSEFDVVLADPLSGNYDPDNYDSTSNDPNRRRGIHLICPDPARKAGEVILVTYENRPATAYGRDLTSPPLTAGRLAGPPDGLADGINFSLLPWDLFIKANGAPFRTDDIQTLAKRLPLGVVVRWIGAKGKEERVELWTVVYP